MLTTIVVHGMRVARNVPGQCVLLVDGIFIGTSTVSQSNALTSHFPSIAWKLMTNSRVVVLTCAWKSLIKLSLRLARSFLLMKRKKTPGATLQTVMLCKTSSRRRLPVQNKHWSITEGSGECGRTVLSSAWRHKISTKQSIVFVCYYVITNMKVWMLICFLRRLRYS